MTEDPTGAGSGRSSGRGSDQGPPTSIAPEPGRDRTARRSKEKAPRTARSKRRRGPLWWLKWVLVAYLVFLVAVPLWAYSTVSKVDAEPSGERPEDEGGGVGSVLVEGKLSGERTTGAAARAERERCGVSITSQLLLSLVDFALCAVSRSSDADL